MRIGSWSDAALWLANAESSAAAAFNNAARQRRTPERHRRLQRLVRLQVANCAYRHQNCHPASRRARPGLRALQLTNDLRIAHAQHALSFHSFAADLRRLGCRRRDSRPRLEALQSTSEPAGIAESMDYMNIQ